MYSVPGSKTQPGSACTSGSLEPSHVLRAMGVPYTAAHGSIRFFNDASTTENEIDFVLYHPEYGVLVLEVKGGLGDTSL